MRLRERIKDALGYYRFRTNWHKLPVVRPFLCSIGAHDYIPEQVLKNGDVRSRCFYCPKAIQGNTTMQAEESCCDEPMKN